MSQCFKLTEYGTIVLFSVASPNFEHAIGLYEEVVDVDAHQGEAEDGDVDAGRR